MTTIPGDLKDRIELVFRDFGESGCHIATSRHTDFGSLTRFGPDFMGFMKKSATFRTGRICSSHPEGCANHSWRFPNRSLGTDENRITKSPNDENTKGGSDQFRFALSYFRAFVILW